MARLTFLGHSCFLVEADGTSILIDPFLTDNPTASTSADRVSCDFILLTHAHGDHIGDAVPIAKRCGATIFTNFEIANRCESEGASVHPMSIGGQWKAPFGRVKLTIAHHASSFPDGTYGGQPAGITFDAGGTRFHHAGDTALHRDMELVGEENIDVAMVPIGDNFTMGIADAARSLDLLRPKLVVPMHYNTWPLIECDPNEFGNLAEAKGVQCVILEPGQSRDV